MEQTSLSERYPRTVKLDDGTQVELRVMGHADRAAVLQFAQGLPEEDVMFLRIDITQPETVESWMRDIDAGLVISLVAYDDASLIGYATVRRDPTPWTRRVGEIRGNVDPRYRSKGLARNLMAQIFDIARSLGLKKVIANMTEEQLDAQTVLKHLGFMPEALLADFVEDRDGNLHDLIVMTHDVDGLTDQAGEPLRV